MCCLCHKRKFKRVIIRSARALTKAIYARLAAPGQIRAYLAESPSPRLNVGCGHNVVRGWMNIDHSGGRHGTIFMDATRPLPLPDDKFDAILCEHLIEHLPEADGRSLIRNLLKVLKPGGRIRIVTPDLESLAQLCVSSPNAAASCYLDFVAKLHGRAEITPGDALNYIFYEYGHRHIYTRTKLRHLLEETGFTNVTEGRAGSPLHPIFDGAEGHPQFMGLENDAFEAFALEARKPVPDVTAFATARA
jgi:predicted SAM-dependent methyltransferase